MCRRKNSHLIRRGVKIKAEIIFSTFGFLSTVKLNCARKKPIMAVFECRQSLNQCHSGLFFLPRKMFSH
jgi:hypothetical protein